MAAGQHRHDIDGLRAIAVLCVLAYHASASLLSGGFIGVDVFFVISGYLITRILLSEMDSGHLSIGLFYARRVRRILPALITVLITCAGMGWLLLLPSEYTALGKHITAGAGFFSNIALWKESGYFDSNAELKPLLHLWSLAVEEQFYLIWPLLLWLLSRARVNLHHALLALCVVSFGASVLLAEHHQVASFFLLHTRMWELALGGLIAHHERSRSTAHRPILSPHLLSVLGIALITIAATSLSKFELYPSWRAAVPVLGTAAILIAGHGAWVNRTLLSSKAMVAIGLISYPLYLWHWPLLSFARITEGGEPSVAIRAGAIALSFLLAWLTTRFIERPIRFGTWRHSPRVIALLLVALVAVGLLGEAIRRSHGFAASRPFDARLSDLAKPDAFRNSKPACPSAWNLSDLSWCVTARDGAPTAAIFGESHADHLFAGLTRDMRHNWLLIGHSSCPPLVDIGARSLGRPEECRDKNARALATLIAAPNIRTVVLASLGPYYMGDTSVTPDHIGKNAAENFIMESTRAEEAGLSKAALFERGLERTIVALQQAGKRVVLFVDVPELDFMPERCLDRPMRLFATATTKQCSIEKARVTARTQEYRAVLKKLAQRHPNVRIFDPTAYLCDADTCYAGTAEMLYYRDSHHLSQRGSEMLMQHFSAWLKEQR
jgi:peptidoglycan/LPS O-acetylase OafA/YrhL